MEARTSWLPAEKEKVQLQSKVSTYLKGRKTIKKNIDICSLKKITAFGQESY